MFGFETEFLSSRLASDPCCSSALDGRHVWPPQPGTAFYTSNFLRGCLQGTERGRGRRIPGHSSSWLFLTILRNSSVDLPLLSRGEPPHGARVTSKENSSAGLIVFFDPSEDLARFQVRTGLFSQMISYLVQDVIPIPMILPARLSRCSQPRGSKETFLGMRRPKPRHRAANLLLPKHLEAGG